MAFQDIPALRFEVDVDGVKYELSPSDDAKVDREDLDTEFSVLPRNLSQWLMLQANLSDKIRRMDYEKKKLWARLDYKVREDLRNADVKFTEKMVENTVITHADYQEFQERIFYYQKAHDMVSAGVESQRVKKDILVSLGANDRTLSRSNARMVQEDEVTKERVKDAIREKTSFKKRKGV